MNNRHNAQPWPTAEFVIGDFDYHDESEAVGNATFLRQPGTGNYYCIEWDRELTPKIGFFTQVTEYWSEGEKPPAKVGDKINTEKEFDALPSGTILRDEKGAWEKGDGWFIMTGATLLYTSAELANHKALTVLWLP